ncbi:MAG: hypothetical protein ACJ8FY_04515 [Gemmataceae bacterium]
MDERYGGLDEAVSAAKLLGYLNFSDGRPDPRWQKLLNDAYAYLADRGEAEPHRTLYAWLNSRLTALQADRVAGFDKIAQARTVLNLVFDHILPAYRKHHADLLFHVSTRDLFQPFFLARVCEAVLAEGVENAGDPDGISRLVANVLTRLNDYVGYRPVAILETRPRGEPYDHERVRPIPLFIRNAGIASGRYQSVVGIALDLLAKTDRALLAEAYFDPHLLDELALDPRAYDHTHPVNRRPNYVFGEWDPHHLDNQGRFRRYVVRQIALDGLMDRLQHPGDLNRDELLFEAGAVLAGTLLMATGISGAGPETHDSTTTLASLMPRIARYRDTFYNELLAKATGAHAHRLRQEAKTTRQAFGAARQQFNRFLAQHRALQLQQRHLAVLYAEIGYPEAGAREADRIPTTSLRLLSGVQGRLTTSRLMAERGDLAAAADVVAQVADLVQRGIACGAFVDPWNILGFQALFPLFAAREDSVRDHRVDELVHMVEQALDVHAWLAGEAAALGNTDLVNTVIRSLRSLAGWWDQFGSVNVGDVRRVVGNEALASAEHISSALVLWHERGAASADLAFWRQHLQGFRSAKAYALIVDALLRKNDFRAAMALIINWLGQAEFVPLEDGEHSFAVLCLRWMLSLTSRGPGDNEVWPLIRKFFDFLEANAEDYWQTPSLESVSDEEEKEESTPAQEVYEAAYEDMTYRDTAEDGTEGALADGPVSGEPFDLEEESSRLEKHLRFLSTVARLWQIAARFNLQADPSGDRSPVLAAWLKVAQERQQKLLQLLDAIHAFPIPEPLGAYEELVEYDRRRIIKEQLIHHAIGTCLDNILALGALQGALRILEGKASEAAQSSSSAETLEGTKWGPLAIQLESALLQGNADQARAALPEFLDLFRHEPLLSQALSEGARPRHLLRVRVAQTILRALAANLPRLGLLRETYRILRVAWASEREHPPAGRGITEFNLVFQAAYQAVVESVVESASGWAPGQPADKQIVELLETLTAPFLTLWIEHSRTLQLSTLEALRTEKSWETLREFIQRYGGDLFHARFMTLANLRAILNRGIGPYLDYLAQNPDPLHPIKLIDDIDRGIRRDEAVACLQIILPAVIENYEEYKDYNTTTTHSDYGDNLHVLLDFLRLKAAYERDAWQFRPLVMAHEVLARAGRSAAAVQWEAAFTQLSGELAQQHLKKLHDLEKAHGIRLITVADRVEERFVKPLHLDRLTALIGPAINEAKQANEQPTFQHLESELTALAKTPTGVGLDAPFWLRRLEMETQRVRASQSAVAVLAEELFRVPKKRITYEDLQQQLREWDTPLAP